MLYQAEYKNESIPWWSNAAFAWNFRTSYEFSLNWDRSLRGSFAVSERLDLNLIRPGSLTVIYGNTNCNNIARQCSSCGAHRQIDTRSDLRLTWSTHPAPSGWLANSHLDLDGKAGLNKRMDTGNLTRADRRTLHN